MSRCIYLFTRMQYDQNYYLSMLLILSSSCVLHRALLSKLASLWHFIFSEEDLLLFNAIDYHNCFLEIHSGAGGIESDDWTNMLLKIYIKWVSICGLRSSIISLMKSFDQGVRAVILRVTGFKAYGRLKTEIGVHRLVRISPFGKKKKRQTSFSNVRVYASSYHSTKVRFYPCDIKLDTYKASGAGGQHVNKTDSAVRLTHIPTMTVVQCRESRSQHRNRESCIAMLKAKLISLRYQTLLSNERDFYTLERSVRSYVLCPYQAIKDIAGSFGGTDMDNIMSGNLYKITRSRHLLYRREVLL